MNIQDKIFPDRRNKSFSTAAYNIKVPSYDHGKCFSTNIILRSI